METRLSPSLKFIDLTPLAVLPRGLNSLRSSLKCIVIPVLDPIKTLSPSFDNLTHFKESPSSRLIAINPFETVENQLIASVSEHQTTDLYSSFSYLSIFIIFGLIVLLTISIIGGIKTRSVVVLLLLLFVIPMQVLGYGLGFFIAFIKRFVLKHGEFTGFQKKYY